MGVFETLKAVAKLVLTELKAWCLSRSEWFLQYAFKHAGGRSCEASLMLGVEQHLQGTPRQVDADDPVLVYQSAGAGGSHGCAGAGAASSSTA